MTTHRPSPTAAPTRRLRPVAVVALALSMTVALAAHAHGGDATLVHACVNSASGVMRLVAPNDACRNGEFPLDWRTAAGSVAPPSGVKQVISTPDAPAAIGPYSQALKISASETMYVAGQLPLDPATNVMVPGGIVEQTHRVMANLLAVLQAGGMTIDNVMMANVYLKDLNDFAAFNAVYASYFGSAPPARATVEVARVPRDALIEIALIAAK